MTLQVGSGSESKINSFGSATLVEKVFLSIVFFLCKELDPTGSEEKKGRGRKEMIDSPSSRFLKRSVTH